MSLLEEIKLTRINKDIALVKKHLNWLDELAEVEYMNAYSVRDGIIKAKAHLYDLYSVKHEIITGNS